MLKRLYAYSDTLINNETAIVVINKLSEAVSFIISSYITNKCEVTYSYITSKCKVTAVFNEGVARVETCCYFALMSYVTRLFTE